MKRISVTVLAILLALSATQLMAQQGRNKQGGKGKAKSEEVRQKTRDHKEHDLEDHDEEVDSLKREGRAYGKNKGELSGREFGTMRADSAHGDKAKKNMSDSKAKGKSKGKSKGKPRG